MCNCRPKVLAIPEFPENTFLWGNVIVVNVGGQSPDWVVGLLRTRSGERLLRRILAGMIRKEKARELARLWAQAMALLEEDR
jgi:hypothetical protein